MRNVTKGWLIADIVIASVVFVFCFSFGVYLFQQYQEIADTPEAAVAIIPLLTISISCLIVSGVSIIPIILNSVGMKIYLKAKRRRHLIVLAIFLIIFGNPVAGILMLCHKDKDLL